MEQLILVRGDGDSSPVFWNGAVLVGMTASRTSNDAELKAKYPASAQVIDAAGKVIFPGFINNHTTCSRPCLKGIGDDMELS